MIYKFVSNFPSLSFSMFVYLFVFNLITLIPFFTFFLFLFFLSRSLPIFSGLFLRVKIQILTQKKMNPLLKLLGLIFKYVLMFHTACLCWTFLIFYFCGLIYVCCFFLSWCTSSCCAS